MATVPPVVLKLTQLEELDLSWNSGIHLPDGLSGLTNIRFLNLLKTDMATVPPVVWRLTQLEWLLKWLDLRSNPLQTLPAEVGQLTNVKHLDLSYCQLRTLPPEVGRLTQLEWLDLSDNPLQTLPAEVGQFTKVKHLDLSYCQLHTLPPEVGRLTQLEWLDLSDNPLQTLPAEVGQFTNVKHLDLSYCQLHTLPPEVGRLTQLEWLDLSANPLQTLPAQVGQLTNVKHLDLSWCQLRTLPPEVGRLTQLEWLDLGSNPLQTLPAEVGQLTNISYLYVYGNPLIKPPSEVCMQGISAVRQYFDKLELSEETVSARLKVAILGEKMAGKTSLVRTLGGGKSTLTKKGGSTQCVEITQWAPDDNITFEVYDFGGHDVYHLTHQFFLTQDALNLLTLNLETYRCTEQRYSEAVGYWLDTLNARVPGSVVTIVCTKIDQCTYTEKEEKTRDIEKRFNYQQETWERNIQQQVKQCRASIEKMKDKSEDKLDELKQQLERTRGLLTRPLRLTGIFCVSSAKPTSGLDILKGHILESANNTESFPSLRRILPRTWVDFEGQLLNLLENGSSARTRPKWLTRRDCLMLGQFAGLRAERLEPVLSYLQQVGTILRYQGIPELKDMVFYDPSGLIDVIKELFHHDLKEVFTTRNPSLIGFSETELTKIRKNLSSRGFLPQEIVIALLGPHATPVGNVEVITNLMEHFGLCYTERSEEQGGEISTTTGYYIPWYIQEERADAINRHVSEHGETEYIVACEITHFCPRGLFERLSVVVNKLIKSRQDWKDIVMAVRKKLPITVYRETTDEDVKIVIMLTIPVQMSQATREGWDVIGPLKDKLLKLLLEWPGLLYHLVLSESTLHGELI
uniref:Leucine-rich repeat protein SHOC-2 n=1 Tax=Branchiostoma floridae TaxID=7739 RepID=C3YRJ5_BRAFL|eukprot:XP_002601180.1 hypothetical protein BRAFLDRAFT_214682 [Branchiostoma floridae]